MDKGIIKSIIYSAALIVSVVIYTEGNKYEIYDYVDSERVLYAVINKKTGAVKTYSLYGDGAIYSSTFEGEKILVNDNVIEEKE